MRIVACLIGTIIGFGGFAVSAQDNGLSGTVWRLTEMNGDKVSNSRAFIEVDKGASKLSGNAECNRIFAGLTIARRTITVSGIGSTRMVCPDQMSAEAEFISALRSVTRYRLDGDSLSMFAGRKVVLRFGTISTDDSTSDDISALADKKWVLDSVKGEAVGPLGTQAFMIFDPAKSSLGGNTSCNVFGGNYTIDKGKFEFSQGISTMRACIEDERMSIERSFLDGLRTADQIEIIENKLTLFRDREALLTFVGTEK